MIRVAVIDDHPALRAGLNAVLDAEPDIVSVGESAGDEESVWPLLRHTAPSLLLLDYHLPRGDGLQLCYRIKREVPGTNVVVFSAYASPELGFTARIAGADGVLTKELQARDLFQALRAIAGGERLLPPVSMVVVEEAYSKIAADDRPIAGMLLDGATVAEIAEVLRRERREIHHAVLRMLAALRLDIPSARS
jgi:DNA-binding NarL/FixJ family response regulator